MPLPRSALSFRDTVVPAAGGLLGGLFFIWIVGLRVLKPTEYNWVMQLDWRIHFLGWHFFRREPWQWPPGRIVGYFHAPDGTALGFTDSIPLVAFLLKPFSNALPATFQYLGLWLLTCFVLQGVFGVLIARIWTTRWSLQLLSAAMFVLMPTLLIRAGHPALCAHFLLLWALWLYFRGDRDQVQPFTQCAALGLTAGLMHPYLAVMVLGILGALMLKDVFVVSGSGRGRLRLRAVAGFASAMLFVVFGWWLSGLFTVSGADNLASEGLGSYSMNLLSPVTPSGWSTFLPEQPTAAHGQTYEGFQYLGVGVLVLIAVSSLLGLRWLLTLPWRHGWPLLLVALACAIYALSPRVTFGSSVLLDLSNPDLERFAVFRATGRFFWPMAYVLVASAIALTVTRLSPRLAFVVLVTACVVQLIDLREAHNFRRVAGRSESLHEHQLRLTSPVWHIALPHYTHMVLYYPAQCGRAATPFEWPAYLAGLYGLTINAGEVARYEQLKSDTYCGELAKRIAGGIVEDDTIYLVNSDLLARFRAAITTPLVCSELDGVPVCMTERSFQLWRHKARRDTDSLPTPVNPA